MIYIVRHRETKLNKENKFSGQQKTSLTKKGEKETKKIGIFFKDKKIEKIYSSDLPRCLIMAKEIKKNTPASLKIDKKLRELNFGLFEGKTHKNIIKQYPKFKGQNLSFLKEYPEGESIKDLKKRLELFVHELDLSKDIVLCTHAKTIEVLDKIFSMKKYEKYILIK